MSPVIAVTCVRSVQTVGSIGNAMNVRRAERLSLFRNVVTNENLAKNLFAWIVINMGEQVV